MKPAFVLCDPALVMPPPADSEGAARFWARFIEWSSDRRVRLGPASFEMVSSLIGKLGWPQFKAENYPPGMAQLAHRALSTMLGQVLAAEVKEPHPRLAPRYHGYEGGEAAIAADAAALHALGLVGLATSKTHWAVDSEKVSLDPPPPEVMYLLLEPHLRLASERDLAVATYLEKRRLTIVGGIPSAQFETDLRELFYPKEIRWLGSQPGARLNLDLLDGLHSRTDVVYCVTGHIGHDGSTRAQKCCRKRGLELRKVEDPKQIVEDLRRRHGGPELPNAR